MNETLEYLQMFARFPFALRRFLKHTITLEEARQIVRERMQHREENFLRLVEKSVYGYPRSPYLPLLKMAGCELGDLRKLALQKGVEGALRQLREAGVYVTFEEFKGRKPIERNGIIIPVTARDFDNPFAKRDFSTQTGGSTGLANTVGQDLEYIVACAPIQLLALAAHQIMDAPLAYWMQILPGTGLRFVLQRLAIQQPVQRWFSSMGWRDSNQWFKYDAATLYMLLCLRLSGASVPFPKIVRLNQAIQVAQWITDMLKAHGRCILNCNPSHALRVCIAAKEAGLDFTGATLRMGGEPLTPAKMKVIGETGARILPSYGMVEVSNIALGCPNSPDSNDVHLLSDMFALNTHPFTLPGTGLTVPAFNLSTLCETTPKVMLNTQMDDYGAIEEHKCGCEFEACGLGVHIHDIRSYSKLVGEGVTLIGNEMVRILEDILPSRFGGTPQDYQLIEDEDEKGFTRLYLVISPRVGIADENAVIQVVLNGLRESSPMADAARAVWQQAQTIQIKRQEPIWTTRGKMMPLHVQRHDHESA